MEKRILIIEDNIDFLNVLKARLEMNGYQTISENNGLIGLQTAKREIPDLILLDLMLPEMDGHKICRIIKFDQKLKHIPVIILTSRDTDADTESAKKCRADAFVLKTINFKILLEIIKEIFDRQYHE
jgi:two-component system phosphate regulon response regulator PhoB